MQPGYILNRGRVLKYILKVPLSKLHIHITAIEDAFKLCADALHEYSLSAPARLTEDAAI